MAFLSGEKERGWIVIDDQSSGFVSIHETEEEAALAVSSLGNGYIYGFGEKKKDSDAYLLTQNNA